MKVVYRRDAEEAHHLVLADLEKMDEKGDRSRPKEPVGILRITDGSTKPRRSQSEVRLLLQGEPPSPQPSVDRLSVTFAEDSIKTESSSRFHFQNSSMSSQVADKVHFPTTDGEDSEEDYSASVNAIIQRKASLRRSRKRSKRRTSSSYSPDILPGQFSRRPSVYTTSSGDTAITVDESPVLELTQEQIFENIRLHKEVLSNVKMQPWNMRKKLKLVMQAKSYVKRHEGALQERFTQTHSLNNMIARWNIYLIKKLHQCRREMANLSNLLIPWERRIKEIESHFGSVVASYFIFLRWLFWVNVVMSAVIGLFVVMPEIIISDTNPDRKDILSEDKYNSTNFLTMWDFEGVLKYTPLFYGWYTNADSQSGYRLPLAYFMTQLAVYIYSFVATLRKMAANSRMSKLSEKDDESIFTWKLFTGWDYMIGNPETAQNRIMSIVMGFKEALLEEAEKKRKARNWKVIWSRVFVNIVVLILFALSAAAVVEVVRRSTEDEANSSIWRRNETTVVMTFLSFVFPMILEFLGFMEQYHPRKQLRIQLGRIMLLNLLNLYSLIFAQFDKIDDMTAELLKFRPNVSSISNDPTTPSYGDSPPTPMALIGGIEPQVICRTICYNYTVEESEGTLASTISTIASTVASTALPKLWEALNLTGSTTESDNFTWRDIYDNVTDENLQQLSSNFLMGFQDYLNFLLGSIGQDANATEANVTDVTDLTSATGYDLLKTTMSTILNTTIDEDGEIPFTAFYTEVSGLVGRFVEKCEEVCETVWPPTTTEVSTAAVTAVATPFSGEHDYPTKAKLRSLCWETMFGQELVKLTVMDLVFTIAGTVGIDFLRGVFVRIMNRCWCWDLEKVFPEYGEFKVAENILALVNNQGMVWMGMFFSPGLVAINIGKLIVLMYLRSWAVLTCNVPHAVVFRASRSNNFYFALLLIMLFLCVLPVGYAIVWVEPSWNCGPFSYYSRIYHILTKTIRKLLPQKLHRAMEYVVSPGIVIPILVILVLIIYYLISLTNSLREANSDLKVQLRQERTEERRKMFQIADRKRAQTSGPGSIDNTPFARWKKLIHSLPSTKSTEEPPPKTPVDSDEEKMHKARDVVVRFLRRAMQKPDNENGRQVEEEATDNEQHDSLPDDVNRTPNDMRKYSNADHSEIRRFHIPDLQKRRNSVDSKRGEEWRQSYRSSSPSNSSKETRQDSITSSIWSDNIPIITISKTESAENILRENGSNEASPKIRNILKKQAEVATENDSDGQCSDDESTKTTVKSINIC
ncbi:hypothetical protein PPYR_10793 [Photinus pyralis]|uniref:TMC domain-containing protein n=1 Tax=Photinus pyralis TaxID=7054 RepID=A0A5N4AHA8_PHOPY|nr:hypothetical protein PPYR_10793 [Photinus pyralis]